MSKGGALVYFLYKLCRTDSSILIWIFATAIETAIISVIVCGLAKLFKDKDFDDTFVPTFIVVGVIEILISILGLF